MDDEFENFLEDQKAKLAKEKAKLQQDPPYMEIRTKAYDSSMKENIPPSKWPSTQRLHGQAKEEGCALSLPLGEYERKKQRLQQELRLGYRRYMAQDGYQNGRNKERCQVLTGYDDAPKLQDHRAASRAPQGLPDASSSSTSPVQLERLPSRRDAAHVMEGITKGRGLWAEEAGSARGRGLWLEEEGFEVADRQGRPRVERAVHDSEPDCSSEEMDLLGRDTRRPVGHSRGTGRPERRPHRVYNKADSDMVKPQERRPEDQDCLPDTGHGLHRPKTDNSRALRERREVEPPVVHERDYREWSQRTTTPRTRPQASARPGERSRSTLRKGEAEFSTGLLIGLAVAEEDLQRRKERYRRELQEQMAEQQRNRKREKDLGLLVAVTGAIDPEKKPDRIQRFRGTGHTRDHIWGDAQPSLRRPPRSVEQGRSPPEQPRVAFQSPLLGALADFGEGGVAPSNQDFSGSLRTQSVPPPASSMLSDVYRTPYDEAYFCYGARTPMDPNPVHYGPVPGAARYDSTRPAQIALPGPQPRAADQLGVAPAGSGIGGFLAEKPKPSNKNVQSYQEALKQQIRERQERRRHEEEERERYEAKLEAEMKAYAPWGRGGGGAPLRDQQGNLITDLNQMHKSNEEAYLNPESRDRRGTGTLDRNLPLFWGEDRTSPDSRVSGSYKTGEESTTPPASRSGTLQPNGLSLPQASRFARGNVFDELSTSKKGHEQDQYKEYLRQQIEDKRRREAEERERLRLEEEKEERRLAEQRARIQKEYEEEQERRLLKEMQQKAKNEELVRQAEERRREEQQRRREQKEKEQEALRQQYERERRAQLKEIPRQPSPRQPSPPIPTLQRRPVSQHTLPTPPMDGRRCERPPAQRSEPGSQSPPVPARRNQLRVAEERQGIISELSALRRKLRSEQRRLEAELLQADMEVLGTPQRVRCMERPPGDVFDMARQRLQVPVRRSSSKSTEPVGMQNVRDSHQPSRGYASSREEWWPSSLDPHCQEGSRWLPEHSILKEQQQRLVSSQRRRANDDYLDLSPSAPQSHSLMKSSAEQALRSSLLASESTFIDPSGHVVPVPPEPDLRRSQLSARERRRLAKRADFCSEVRKAEETGPTTGHADICTVRSETCYDQSTAKRREGRAPQPCGDGDMSSDEKDHALAPERFGSLETVSAETWMRPDTADTLTRLVTGQSRRERPSIKDSVVHTWEGPSTYHG